MGFTALQEEEFVEDNERMDIIGQNGNDGLHYDDVEPDDNNNPNPQPSARGGVKIQ
jgi:hypothetical protein